MATSGTPSFHHAMLVIMGAAEATVLRHAARERARARQPFVRGANRAMMRGLAVLSMIIFAADAAADEQRAARMSKASNVVFAEQLFPGLCSIRHDKTHGSTRLVENPWKHIAHIHQMLDSWVFGKNSLVMMAQQNSHEHDGIRSATRPAAIAGTNGWEIRHIAGWRPGDGDTRSTHPPTQGRA